MPTPDSIPSGLKAQLDQIIKTRSATSAQMVRHTQLTTHLLGSTIAATLFLATDLPAVMAIVCYVGAAAMGLTGAWMHLTLLNLLRESVAWQWWAWTGAIVTVAALDLLVDL